MQPSQLRAASARVRLPLDAWPAHCALLACLVLPQELHAQVIERNPAPVAQPEAPQAAPPIEMDRNADPTPLGMNLRGISLFQGDAVPAESASDLDLGASAVMPGLARRIRPFLGQPLSRRLIGEIKAAIAQVYRRNGRPFVHISAPEQDISAGYLRLRVEEFRMGAARVSGTGAGDAKHIAGGIRQSAGEPIDARALGEDLNWLNRYPFRRVEAVFEPGAQPATTDVTYTVSRQRPWSIGAGYSNSGSPNTGMNRFFAYALIGLPVPGDGYASYQLTTSGQRLAGLGDKPGGSRRYVSHAGRVWLGLGARTSLDLSLADIRSNQPVEVFDVEQHTREYGLTLRSALGNLQQSLRGEVYLGLDWKEQASRLLFAGLLVRPRTRFHVGQVTLGYALQDDDSLGSTTIDIAAHASPGGIDSYSTSAAYRSVSFGQFSTARYVYFNGLLARRNRLGPVSLIHQLSWQYSGIALPQTEQMGVGGRGQVRAYTLDDGAFDRGVVLRNELRLDAGGILGRSRLASQVEPWFYLDGGYAGRARGGAVGPIAATGIGVDWTLARHVMISADGGVAMKSLGNTKAGDFRANLRVSVTF